MGFLKFLLVVFIISFLGYLFFRYALPWLLKRWLKRFARKMNPKFAEEEKKQKQKSKRKDGDINIDFIPDDDTPSKTDSNSDSDKGEYIDYEEI